MWERLSEEKQVKKWQQPEEHNIMLDKQIKRKRRHNRVRAKIHGTAIKPRLCVFRSSSHTYAQVINDEKGETLAKASDLEIKKAKASGNLSTKVAKGHQVGKLVAEKAIAKKLKKVVFDRGGYKYHGVVKAVADGAREGGLEF